MYDTLVCLIAITFLVTFNFNFYMLGKWVIFLVVIFLLLKEENKIDFQKLYIDKNLQTLQSFDCLCRKLLRNRNVTLF